MTETRHRVPTFKPRRRRLSPSRSELFDRLSDAWCVPVAGELFDAAAEFGRSAPLVLDIGIGSGDALIEAALAEPHLDVIGADVHTPGVAATAIRLDELGVGNVRVVHGDALRFAERLPERGLAGIRLYFPDPWPKAKHRARRMISATNLDRFAALLAPGGFLHVATDIGDYAAMTRRLGDAHRAYEGGVIARPATRPSTKYEEKGLVAGRASIDLLYRRR